MLSFAEPVNDSLWSTDSRRIAFVRPQTEQRQFSSPWLHVYIATHASPWPALHTFLFYCKCDSRSVTHLLRNDLKMRYACRGFFAAFHVICKTDFSHFMFCAILRRRALFVRNAKGILWNLFRRFFFRQLRKRKLCETQGSV